MGADAGQLAVLDHQVLVANGLLVEEALQDLAHTRSVASLQETAVRGAIGLGGSRECMKTTQDMEPPHHIYCFATNNTSAAVRRKRTWADRVVPDV
jgi:hypothetical protein